MKKLKNKIQEKDGVKIISTELVEDNVTRIAILLPHTYPNYTSDFFLSFTGVLSHTYYWNYANGRNYAFDIVTPPKNLAGIGDIRNGLAEIALRTGADYMMWMDSDQTYPPDTIVKMLRHFESADSGNKDLEGLEAVGGLITYKSPPYLPHLYIKKHKTKPTYHLASNYVLNQLFKVEGVGFGCVMIKSKVFDRVKKPYFEFTVDDNGKMVSGEDLGFCIKADMSIIIDPTIVIGHQKLVSYDINDFIKYNGLEVKDGVVVADKEKISAIYDEHTKIE